MGIQNEIGEIAKRGARRARSLGTSPRGTQRGPTARKAFAEAPRGIQALVTRIQLDRASDGFDSFPC